ncbi:hypothetical protein VFPPC_18683 [Pochonia chlamydosporia 170]|uniref:Uncharacterized protein n=1 Tax=Pochonia chlamydosporia 170 TaxID=1380566 RepID=A0A219AS53_METCM|nr:hypothetical protein VFPPC_18683 [Pochonia chlamydosporia 170]OWT43590.1 hypothetical protein VFPPC_18683 [Pochonia chlamydosporia 170]
MTGMRVAEFVDRLLKPWIAYVWRGRTMSSKSRRRSKRRAMLLQSKSSRGGRDQLSLSTSRLEKKKNGQGEPPGQGVWSGERNERTKKNKKKNKKKKNAPGLTMFDDWGGARKKKETRPDQTRLDGEGGIGLMRKKVGRGEWNETRRGQTKPDPSLRLTKKKIKGDKRGKMTIVLFFSRSPPVLVRSEERRQIGLAVALARSNLVERGTASGHLDIEIWRLHSMFDVHVGKGS